MKVYVPAFDGTKRSYDSIDTTRAAYHRWASGSTTVMCDGICHSGDALYATADAALTYGWSRGLDHYANALSARELDWKLFYNHVTGEYRVNRDYYRRDNG